MFRKLCVSSTIIIFSYRENIFWRTRDLICIFVVVIFYCSWWFYSFHSANSSFFNFSFISSIVVRRFPFIAVFSFGKKKKSAGAKSGEYNGWRMITVLFLAKNSSTSINMWAVALSWCKTHDLYVSAEILRAIFLQLKGSIPYWQWDLVTRIHDAPRH